MAQKSLNLGLRGRPSKHKWQGKVTVKRVPKRQKQLDVRTVKCLDCPETLVRYEFTGYDRDREGNLRRF